VTVAVRSVLRLVPSDGPVLVGGSVPDDVLAALHTRGDHLTAADEPAAAALAERLGRAALSVAAADTAVVRPTGRAPLPRADTVVTDLVLAGPDGTDLAALKVLADVADRRVTSEHLALEPDGGVRWVATWRTADDEVAGGRPAAVVLAALTAAIDLLSGELAGTTADLGSARWQVTDRNQRLRAAERAVTVAQGAADGLTARLAGLADATPADRADAAAAARPAGAGGGGLLRRLLGDRTLDSPSGPARPPSPLDRLPGQTAGLRVATLGDGVLPWAAGAVRVRPVTTPLGDEPLLTSGHDHLEAVLVGETLPTGWTATDGTALLAAAAALGAPRVGVRTRVDGVAWFDGHVDAEVAPTADTGGGGIVRVPSARPVQPAAAVPAGFLRLADGPLAVVPDGPLTPGTAAALRTAAAGRGRSTDDVEALVGTAPATADDGPGGLPTRVVPALAAHDLPGLLDALRTHRAVLDHPGLHADAGAHAHWLTTLALARVPLLLAEPLPATVVGLLGAPLAAVLAGTTSADLHDHVARERRTVLALRAAWTSATPTALWRRLAPAIGLPAPRRPEVSMVLATNRPDHLLHAVGQAAAQTWGRSELVVVLHGDAFEPGWEDRVTARAAEVAPDLPVVVRRAGSELLLGEVLDVGCEAAGGDLVTKVDDDDWYSPDHVVDLLAAREQSGAHLVGKAAEFTHLAALDLTIRRMADGAERPSRSVAGGTFLLARHDLWSLGGWPHTPRFVDQRLLDALEEAGGLLHRTHGFGYVLNRHGVGHTWDADTDYFLRQAVTQHPGLALDVAGVR
jgi:hypothetical protein